MYDPKSVKQSELHAITSAMKAVSTTSTVRGLQECREACGGLGYSYYSKIGILRNHSDISQTWEGDNNVLLQQTSKYLLDLIKNKFKGKMTSSSISDFIKVEPVEGTQLDIKNDEELLKTENLVSIFEHRVNLLLQRSAMKLSSQLQDENKINPIEAWNNTQAFYLNPLGKTFGELFVV